MNISNIEHHRIYMAIHGKNRSQALAYNDLLLKLEYRGVKNTAGLMLALASKVLKTNK